ncbi:MAG: amino acid adenylation domain-containing protein, partial [Ktedonobacteraceae bacterium]|nr:amino acid adenylation domain-containing protein [Ktedonobacteraceae bacterium]
MADALEEDATIWEGIQFLDSDERTNYPFMVNMDDLGEGFAMEAQVQSPADPESICSYMHTALEQLVEVLEDAPTTPMRCLDVLPAAERNQLLLKWNETKIDYRPALDGRCIHELFEQQVERRPEAVALVYDDQQLSYAEVNARANRLARRLRRLGVGPEIPVGICTKRSEEMVVGLLGILKAGGAYVPLDPAYPEERIRFMLKDAGIELLVTERRLEGVLPEFDGEMFVIDAEWEEIGEDGERGGESRAMAENQAYIIYTSGSTGRPKGVSIPHRNAVGLFCWMEENFSAEELSGVLASTSLCFDLSIFELLGTLSLGGKVILVKDVFGLIENGRAMEVRLINTVPSAMRELLRVGGVPAGVRTVNLAGEALRRELVDELYELGVEEVKNLYGPTEDTTYSTGETVEREAGRGVTIGTPLSNKQVYILDARLDPVPVGAKGELYIGGAGLARGYLGRAELTAERFIPNGYSGKGGERLYRTGDVCRYLVDGRIEYLGRTDEQVKVRGYRIELGEIEAALSEQEWVRQSVVVVKEGESGDRRLVGYVVGEGVTPAELKSRLRERLPEYMVPAAIVMLEKMPLTPNGKLDRRSLPEPEGEAYGARAYEEPEGETEKRLAKIWAEVLKVERVGRGENFFELGGHSLLAVRLIEMMRREGLHADVRDLFSRPTVAELAGVVSRESGVMEVPANGIPAD